MVPIPIKKQAILWLHDEHGCVLLHLGLKASKKVRKKLLSPFYPLLCGQAQK